MTGKSATTNCSSSFERPKPSMRVIAEEMLQIIFSEDATDQDIQAAASTLVDAVAPDIMLDAVRWMFVRGDLAQMHSPKMDGQHSYRFRPLRCKGTTVDEAIDKEMDWMGDEVR